MITGKKYNKFIPLEDYFTKGLYMLDIGQNDLATAFYSKTLDQILASIPRILAEFETGIKVRLGTLAYRISFSINYSI